MFQLLLCQSSSPFVSLKGCVCFWQNKRQLVNAKPQTANKPATSTIHTCQPSSHGSSAVKTTYMFLCILFSVCKESQIVVYFTSQPEKRKKERDQIETFLPWRQTYEERERERKKRLPHGDQAARPNVWQFQSLKIRCKTNFLQFKNADRLILRL